MLNKIAFLFLLSSPTLLFGQSFKLINSFQIDTFERAILDDPGLDFVMLANLSKGYYSISHISNVDGTALRNSGFSGAHPKQFSKNLQIKAHKNKKFGFINPNGEIIIPLEYDYLGSQFVEGKILGKKKDQWFFIDTLNQVSPFPDSSPYKTLEIVNSKSIIAVKNKDEYWLLDWEGKPLHKKKISCS